MDDQTINLLAWQKSRGLRFPVMRNICASPNEELKTNVVPTRLRYRCICPFSGDEAAVMPQHPRVLFLSVAVTTEPELDVHQWTALLGKIASAMKLQAGEVFHLLCENSPELDDGRSIDGVLEILRPTFMIILGQECLELFPKLAAGHELGSLRGQLITGPDASAQNVLATWHPRTLITRPELKKDVWADMQIVMQKIASGS
jgi:hypothetical protein